MQILLLTKSETVANISDQQPEGKANQIPTKKSSHRKQAADDKSDYKKDGFHTFIITSFCFLFRLIQQPKEERFLLLSYLTTYN